MTQDILKRMSGKARVSNKCQELNRKNGAMMKALEENCCEYLFVQCLILHPADIAPSLLMIAIL